MRALALGLFALAVAVPSRAQEAPLPDATVVAPAHAGEALRVTTAAALPSTRGRLAQRYRGLRAERSPRTASGAVDGVVRTVGLVERAVDSPRHRFVQRGGTFFQVLPAPAPDAQR